MIEGLDELCMRISPRYRKCNDCGELTSRAVWINKGKVKEYGVVVFMELVLARVSDEFWMKWLCVECFNERLTRGGLFL